MGMQDWGGYLSRGESTLLHWERTTLVILVPCAGGICEAQNANTSSPISPEISDAVHLALR